jgi:hypothetical protein
MNLWSGEGKRPDVGRRTWVLLGVLVLAIVWALSENRKPGPATTRPMSLSATPATAVVLPATGAKISPEGWGRDPFDPNRAVGSRETGR